jgi:biotin carboxyl carrier protein
MVVDSPPTPIGRKGETPEILMKRYQITLDGQAFEVHLLGDPLQEQVQVEVDGLAFTAEVKDLSAESELDTQAAEPVAPSPSRETPAARPTPVAQAAPSTGNSVTAPLPGVIKSVHVRPGQQVSSGDALLVIEAMKMDNIIRASRDGTVETIYVNEGHQVSYGERLLDYALPGST